MINLPTLVLEMNLEDLVRRTALRIKLNKVGGSIIHHIALLKRGLENNKVQCEMIQGFCIIPQTKEACTHYWLRETETGLDLDVGFAVACLRTPELAAIHPVLLEELPEGMTRSDEGELTITSENQALFDLYHKDPKDFWRQAPSDVKGFSIK
ncbi:hypothetical protein [Yellowstone lake phycodnavirus 2]|uniref:hypothetical protein n=1 Tax=Yellowstone lake phycodnavirus 2 TaxID=1586714 RepID=UPI0006EB6280|nr:hypothetical protein AR678_gp097 [Yellowstone lake phycodnavirus 2]BAT22371.1 hypothetical protein [Yellowstone lake phycodnavirus 2]